MKTVEEIFMIVKFEQMLIPCTLINCEKCANKTNCDMHIIAEDMIMRGEY